MYLLLALLPLSELHYSGGDIIASVENLSFCKIDCLGSFLVILVEFCYREKIYLRYAPTGWLVACCGITVFH